MTIKRIIIVDDDPGVRYAFSLVFDPLQYEVIIYSNGDHLLNDDYSVPDLFILDKQLNGVDGMDLCRHLKSQSKSLHIPVIMLSAHPKIHEMALAAGADDALEKPFSLISLRELTAKHLEKSRDGSVL